MVKRIAAGEVPTAEIIIWLEQRTES